MTDQITKMVTKHRRLIAALTVVSTLALIGHVSGATAQLDVASLQALLQDAGAIGMLAFVLLFALGNLLGVPGVLFVVAGLVAYGQLGGAILALVAGLFVASTSFWTVRLIGGSPAAALKGRLAQRLLGRLDARPVQTVAALRTLMILSPPLNYALALSPIRYRDYVLGSAIGLIAPIAFYALLLEQLVGCGLLEVTL
jgi:uncharacterized membrane protein YdjX (TVP38/TMEM64 family)